MPLLSYWTGTDAYFAFNNRQVLYIMVILSQVFLAFVIVLCKICHGFPANEGRSAQTPAVVNETSTPILPSIPVPASQWTLESIPLLMEDDVVLLPLPSVSNFSSRLAVEREWPVISDDKSTGVSRTAASGIHVDHRFSDFRKRTNQAIPPGDTPQVQENPSTWGT